MLLYGAYSLGGKIDSEHVITNVMLNIKGKAKVSSRNELLENQIHSFFPSSLPCPSYSP